MPRLSNYHRLFRKLIHSFASQANNLSAENANIIDSSRPKKGNKLRSVEEPCPSEVINAPFPAAIIGLFGPILPPFAGRGRGEAVGRVVGVAAR